MKNLIAFSCVVFALISFGASASSVSVNIDGEVYTCVQGGAAAGPLGKCTCLVELSPYYNWEWSLYKQGNYIEGNSYINSEDEAKSKCTRAGVSNPNCFN